MIPVLTENLHDDLAHYIATYDKIRQDYMQDVASMGLDFEETDETDETLSPLIRSVCPVGINSANDGKSLFYGSRSLACEYSRKGDKSITFYLSLRCNHHCFYCFNPNQEGYETYQQELLPAVHELEEMHAHHKNLACIALSGGEPLLHPHECIQFFQRAHSLYPKAHLRLYTAGDLLTEQLTTDLKDAGLNEIRISIKPDESIAGQEKALRGLSFARTKIPAVWVEMPVFPNQREWMEKLLLRLDKMNIDGINLLELCFPFSKAEEFVRRGYRLKRSIARVIYDYWYAGGLAIAGSEQETLHLLEFASSKKLRLHVHYCSLENKHTAQIYEQNHGVAGDDFLHFSPRDFFIKTAKCFGEDAIKAISVLSRDSYRQISNGIEIPLTKLKKLPADIQLGIAYYVVEHRPEGLCLREVSIIPYLSQTIQDDPHYLEHL